MSRGEAGQERSEEDRGPGSIIKSPDRTVRRARGGGGGGLEGGRWEKPGGAELTGTKEGAGHLGALNPVCRALCANRLAGCQLSWRNDWLWYPGHVGLSSGGPEPSKISSHFQVPSYVLFLNVCFFL